MEHLFRDRTDAGTQLGALVALRHPEDGGIVLGLPRGGVPVAAAVADATGMDLDVLVVRKVGVPWYPELAMGAIAAGHVVVNDDVVAETGVSEEAFASVVRSEQEELERRERRYRAGRRPLQLAGKTVVVVDDGVATGATIRVAVAAVRASDPASIIVATPVASVEAVSMLGHIADDVVTCVTPEPFGAVGTWYGDFRQTTDEEVIDALRR